MHIVSDNTFGYSMILSIGIPKKKDLIKILKVNKIPYTDPEIEHIYVSIKEKRNCHATTFSLNSEAASIVIFYYWNEDANDYGTLVHEVFHVVDVALRDRGIKLSDDSDEVYAYSMAYFTREFFHKLWVKK